MEAPAQPTESWQMLLAPTHPACRALWAPAAGAGGCSLRRVWGGAGNSMCPKEEGSRRKRNEKKGRPCPWNAVHRHRCGLGLTPSHLDT